MPRFLPSHPHKNTAHPARTNTVKKSSTLSFYSSCQYLPLHIPVKHPSMRKRVQFLQHAINKSLGNVCSNPAPGRRKTWQQSCPDNKKRHLIIWSLFKATVIALLPSPKPLGKRTFKSRRSSSVPKQSPSPAHALLLVNSCFDTYYQTRYSLPLNSHGWTNTGRFLKEWIRHKTILAVYDSFSFQSPHLTGRREYINSHPPLSERKHRQQHGASGSKVA